MYVSFSHQPYQPYRAPFIPTDRVLYSEARLVKLGEIAAQQATPFSVEDRMGLINDVMALATAGFTDMSSVLSLIQVLCKDERERAYFVVCRLHAYANAPAL